MLRFRQGDTVQAIEVLEEVQGGWSSGGNDDVIFNDPMDMDFNEIEDYIS